MPTFLTDTAYDRLLSDLAGAFVTAATNTGTDLHDELVKALMAANVLPSVCCENYGPEGLRVAAA
ncbi:hypothetical protein [Neotabrizicola sp. VNH66]|uniref:hypothetical protein n=1 Tax=Neotabrizicola sp. VNH66 TaxID=3400918 RepID=UPI003BFFB84C